MFGKIFEQVSKFILLPLIKELTLFIYSEFKKYQAKKEAEKKISQTVERSINEGDQRPIEDIVSNSSGNSSGRGVVVDDLPNVGMRDKKKD